MLFLYRPRQTWMPYRLPRQPTEQQRYNRDLQDRYAATRRVARPEVSAGPAPVAPARDPVDALKELAGLRASGVLTDAEFEAAKSKLLAGEAS
jgi:hypothetical protein